MCGFVGLGRTGIDGDVWGLVGVGLLGKFDIAWWGFIEFLSEVG